jgi:geranylgeranyl reductase family protein
MYDVAIVGAGPAGATAALKLAEAGAHVVLLEAKGLPRYKTCGGGIVYRARRLLKLDIGRVIERECFSARMTLLESGLSFQVQRDKPLISMTMRASFDYLLASAAQAAGAVIQTRSPVRAISYDEGQVRLATSRGPVQAKFAIAADGVNSVVARSAGWKETRRLIPAIEAEVYLPDKAMTRHVGSARFDFDLPRHGYAWLFPKSEHLSIGVLNMRRGSGGLKHIYAQYLNAADITHILKEERHGFVIPLSPRQDGFARNRVLLVGDSAGFADPVTGEGISFAIQSGQIAAEALLAARFDAHRALAAYEQGVRETIVPELAAARLLARFLYGSARFRAWAFGRYGEKFTDVVTDIIMGTRSYRESLCRVKNYLKLLKPRDR